MAKDTNCSKITDLERLAEEEILREAKRAVARSEISGIDGFKKCPLIQTNKRFLVNTIVNNIQSNRIKDASNDSIKRPTTSSISEQPVKSKKKCKEKYNKNTEKDTRKSKS